MGENAALALLNDEHERLSSLEDRSPGEATELREIEQAIHVLAAFQSMLSTARSDLAEAIEARNQAEAAVDVRRDEHEALRKCRAELAKVRDEVALERGRFIELDRLHTALQDRRKEEARAAVEAFDKRGERTAAIRPLPDWLEPPLMDWLRFHPQLYGEVRECRKWRRITGDEDDE